jgi:Na+/H+ antiporter NhaC
MSAFSARLRWPDGLSRCFKPSLIFFLLALLAGILVGLYVAPTWTVEKVNLDVSEDEEGRLWYQSGKGRVEIPHAVPIEESDLNEDRIRQFNATGTSPEVTEQYTREIRQVDGRPTTLYFRLQAKRHWGLWSLLPAAVAVGLCWMIREPLMSLLGGIVVGAFMLGRYNITDAVFVKSFASEDAAGVLLLYLWLLGGLLGVWSRTGAAKAFADLMTRKFVRGPKTAKLVAWTLGVIFFQGGTVSTVLVGTTVKPLADRERVSHEELAYIVDSTASPIASQLAFNAWPGYIQGFIYVAGVSWLATRGDRIWFFFTSVPFCFYAIFAVSFTFLLSLERSPFLGRRMRAAIKRARQTGQLDHPDAEPLAAKELHASHVPEGYTPHVMDFFAPLLLLIGIAVGTFVLGFVRGTSPVPQVRWAFGAALILAIAMALARGMRLKDVIDGVTDGLKGVVLGSVILMLAITIGLISRDAGGGIYLVELLGDRVPYWALPVMLQLLTMIIAFSTGTSWGTYAVAFPLAMPLAWAVAQANGLDHPRFFMTLCFAAVMDGSVYGDQCSPISDTTVLSSMCCGCDLMDHVRTQLPQASVAALMAAICWTAVTVLFC